MSWKKSMKRGYGLTKPTPRRRFTEEILPFDSAQGASWLNKVVGVISPYGIDTESLVDWKAPYFAADGFKDLLTWCKPSASRAVP